MKNTSSLPKPLKTLLLSLAVSNLGVGLLAQPLYIAEMVNHTDFLLTTFNVAEIIFTVASFLTVVVVDPSLPSFRIFPSFSWGIFGHGNVFRPIARERKHWMDYKLGYLSCSDIICLYEGGNN